MIHSRVFLMAAALLAMPVLAAIDTTTPAEPADALLAGCGDIPEIVSLVAELRVREQRIRKYLETIDRREADLKAARDDLARHAAKLAKAKPAQRPTQSTIDEDITKLIAVYNQMPPKNAGAVLSTLPPKFAAEIMMRISPENSARIMASVPPEQAAILTSFMGARSARNP